MGVMNSCQTHAIPRNEGTAYFPLNNTAMVVVL